MNHHYFLESGVQFSFGPCSLYASAILVRWFFAVPSVPW